MTEIVFLESNGSGTGATAMAALARSGFRVVLLAHNPAEYESLSPPNPLGACDELIVVDTFSIDKILAALAGRQPAGVIAFDDYRVVQAAAAAQALGLPHAGVRGLVTCRFKHLTRRATRGVGRSVDFEVVSVDDDVQSCRILPCVVKPVDDSGSVGVRVCKSVDEVRAALAVLRDDRVNRRGYVRSECVLLEEFVEGREFSAELVWDRDAGRWEIVGFTRKLLGPEPYCVELGHVFPHRFPPDEDARLRETVLGWVSAAGLRGTVAHVEFKHDPRRPALLEINPRPAGDFIPELVQMATGVDLLATYVALHLQPGHAVPQLAGGDRAEYAAVWFRTGDGDGEVHDSYERTGHAIAAGRTSEEALLAAQEAAGASGLQPAGPR